MRYLFALLLFPLLIQAQSLGLKDEDTARWNKPYITYGIKCTFSKDKAALRSGSEIALDSVYDFLKRYPAFIIEVSCLTKNFKGSKKQEDDFKVKVRNAVVDKLIEKGIEKDRLVNAWGHHGKLKITDAEVAGIEQNKPMPFSYALEFRILSKDYVDPKAPKK